MYPCPATASCLHLSHPRAPAHQAPKKSSCQRGPQTSWSQTKSRSLRGPVRLAAAAPAAPPAVTWRPLTVRKSLSSEKKSILVMGSVRGGRKGIQAVFSFSLQPCFRTFQKSWKKTHNSPGRSRLNCRVSGNLFSARRSQQGPVAVSLSPHPGPPCEGFTPGGPGVRERRMNGNKETPRQ